MPNSGNEKNWPDVIFKWVLGIIGSGIFILGTSIFEKLDKVTDSQGQVKELIGTMNLRVEKVIDAVSYLRNDVEELKDENKELRREIERLKEVNRLR